MPTSRLKIVISTDVGKFDVWPCIIYISKDMYQLDATIYYDFILINNLYMFWTFTCPSSGVLIYRLFTAACGVMPCEKHD